MTKVMVIGLDGATLNLVEPWARQGYLPALNQLLENGSYTPLESVLPVLSPAAWASFMTGMNPGKHGFYDFVRREPSGYRLRPLQHNQMGGESLWKVLSNHGLRVGVINVPMTYPPEEVNGFLISGLGTPEYSSFTYPEDLEKQVRAAGFQTSIHTKFSPGKEMAFIQEVERVTDSTTKIAVDYFKSFSPDFFMVVYRGTDEMAHFLWKYMDKSHLLHNPSADAPYQQAILSYYKKIDQTIEQLLNIAGEDTTVIIMSDHGSGPLYQDVYLNEWLKLNGFLITKNKANKHKNLQWLSRLGITRENISDALQYFNLNKLEHWIKSQLGDRIETLPRTHRMEFPHGIDWEKTKAYSFGYHGQIFINQKGREPEGIVEPGKEYDQVCQEIEHKLRELIHPIDKLPVVDQVIRGNDAFWGAQTRYAPDLLVIMRNLSFITRHGFEFGNRPAQIFSTPASHQSGSHRLDGLLIMAGENIMKSTAIQKKAQIMDLAPTILHLLDCPIPSNMDGNVLQDWLTTTRPIKIVKKTGDLVYPSKEQNSFSQDDEENILDQLKKLGYLD